jgi:endonuclease/exonuclease/phosphatase family metal-dependent hydrolase
MSYVYCRFTWARLAHIVLLAISLALPGMAGAKDNRELVVMTQNLYLGSSLTPAMEAEDIYQFLYGVATIYGTVNYTNFPVRAAAIAEKIAAKNPDLIGLQEVENWISVGPGPYPSQDFLAILMQALKKRGLSYSVASISNNANIGPVPLVACNEFDPSTGYPACWLTMQDRDVILANNRTPGLKITNSQHGNYDTQESILTPVGPLNFNRGWTYVEGKFKSKAFRFVNTHLEEESYPATQDAQAREFLAGPANTNVTLIAIGDFNSAADGSRTPAYTTLTSFYFNDAWNVNPGDPGYTCCQDGTLSNSSSLLEERIDLILTRGAISVLNAEMINDQPFRESPPFWPSDHTGVISTILFH